MVVNREAEADLRWWIELLQDFNGHSVIQPSEDIIIATDASKTGWGATDQSSKTGGIWIRQEKTAHINFLEKKAV